jgi:DNA-binding beta-propeller fold protein YncE
MTEYVVANPVSEMHITDSGRFAVAIVRPETVSGTGVDYYQDARWGLSIMDLSGEEQVSLVAQSQPLGLALVEDAENAYGLVLLDGSDTLLQVNLAQPTASVEIDLPAPPLGIASMPDGKFVITHNQSLGMISILDPSTLELETMSNFAVTNLFEQKELPRTGEGEQ